MKHGNKGMSIAEVCLAALIVGLLYSVLAHSIAGVGSHHGRLLQRVAAMSWVTSFTSALSQPEVLKQAVLKEPDSSKLLECLSRGCSIGTEGGFALSAEEAIPSGLRVNTKFSVITNNLVELRMQFNSTDTFLNARSIRILLSRRSFMPQHSEIAESSCSFGVGYKPQHIVGFDAKNGNFICRDPYIRSGAQSTKAPYRVPASGLGREWKR